MHGRMNAKICRSQTLKTMMRSILQFILVLAVVVIPSLNAQQGNLRKPNPAEQKVLGKYITTITVLLDQFLSDDWDETKDYSVDEQVYVHRNSGRPLDIDEMFQRSYDAHPGSERYASKIEPLIEKLEQAQDMNEKMKIGAEAQKLMHLRVEVHFNRANLGDIEPPPGQNRDLQIPGTALAYKTKNNVTTPGSAACVLAFGHWQPLKWNAEHGWYHFTFTHPVNTPFIENIEIRMYGAEDRIDELLHNVDWKQVNGALAP
jgi:hypothetical protein